MLVLKIQTYIADFYCVLSLTWGGQEEAMGEGRGKKNKKCKQTQHAKSLQPIRG